QLVDLDTGEPRSAAVLVRGAHAVLPGSASGVLVESVPGGATRALVGAGAQGGAGSAWQIFAPWDFRAGTLSADFGQLGTSDRLAVLLVNFAGADRASLDVAVEGSGAVAQDAPRLQELAAAPSGAHELLRAREAELALE